MDVKTTPWEGRRRGQYRSKKVDGLSDGENEEKRVQWLWTFSEEGEERVRGLDNRKGVK